MVETSALGHEPHSFVALAVGGKPDAGGAFGCGGTRPGDAAHTMLALPDGQNTPMQVKWREFKYSD
ncbi:hypothetical protein GA0061099_1001272 [Bradyrhizobium yuanmingense]|uniref:Uncharacterized protein n=1 Tax=Bradyrhizobium yuanmingense TaxID=108015 RepID=A0A1C3TZQ8_9BRAD|nr:hypothetical protein [Bradyrhizobium yuanmingense]TWI30593.1 hypothetical protein IQ15_01488 [Bradyrhizobium yuanmingense]SCB08622.1 hypothetical protein GA0061099_1001272 [Bradyrhizobium yuanmingense]